MSEKLSSQAALDDATNRSIANEHGAPYPLHESHSNNNFDGQVQYTTPGTSDNEMLKLYSSLESDADRDKRIATETGTIDPNKQKIVRDLQKLTFNDEALQEGINELADEPNAIEKVIEMRLRRSLGDNHTKSLNKDTLHADLKIIDLALEHGIDVGAMRIDAEPMMHEGQDSKPVGAWLDRLADEINVVSIASLENPDKLVAARDQIVEIRNKLKDPEETPAEKEQREQAEAKAKAEEEERTLQETRRLEEQQSARDAIEEAMKAQRQSYEAELDAKQLGHEIYEQKQLLKEASDKYTSLKDSLGFFQQRFGKGKKKLTEAAQNKLSIEQKLAELETAQAQKIALIEGPNSAI